VRLFASKGSKSQILQNSSALMSRALKPPASYAFWGKLHGAEFVALANLMRLSLLKPAHAVMSGAAYRKSGSPIVFNPCTRKSRTWSTRPESKACGEAWDWVHNGQRKPHKAGVQRKEITHAFQRSQGSDARSPSSFAISPSRRSLVQIEIDLSKRAQHTS
jgi:hypothetical protein